MAVDFAQQDCGRKGRMVRKKEEDESQGGGGELLVK
jgi:hypothetical protein